MVEWYVYEPFLSFFRSDECLSEEEEKSFQIERAQSAARSLYRNHVESPSSRGGGRGRGRGRGGASDRGGRGGRGGGRGGKSGRFADRKTKNGKDDKDKPAESDPGNGVPSVVASGEKRKREVEDDGSAPPPPPPDAMSVGDREDNASASKKLKEDA